MIGSDLERRELAEEERTLLGPPEELHWLSSILSILIANKMGPSPVRMIL